MYLLFLFAEASTPSAINLIVWWISEGMVYYSVLQKHQTTTSDAKYWRDAQNFIPEIAFMEKVKIKFACTSQGHACSKFLYGNSQNSVMKFYCILFIQQILFSPVFTFPQLWCVSLEWLFRGYAAVAKYFKDLSPHNKILFFRTAFSNWEYVDRRATGAQECYCLIIQSPKYTCLLTTQWYSFKC